MKLLIAEVEDHEVTPLVELSEQTRLGRGFYDSHQLKPEAIAHTAQAVATFAMEARNYDIDSIRIVATSAARDAVNAMDLIHAVSRAADLPIEIISGDEEAELVFQGVTSDPRLENQRLLILDVGGGSTEFIVGEKGHHSFRESFAMGSVRLMETLRPQDPPSLSDLTGCRAWLQEYFDGEIGPRLEGFLHDPSSRNIQLVGTGGTTSILARMHHRLTSFDRATIEGTILTRRQILDTMVDLWSLSLDNRRHIQGLPTDRADIIIMGVAIYEAVISHFQFAELYVSTRGLRFGALRPRD